MNDLGAICEKMNDFGAICEEMNDLGAICPWCHLPFSTCTSFPFYHKHFTCACSLD